ncbi:MAG TPA: 16S rRNA (uracil(1498)-N(3))-methyltransferase [Micropepsaceae bacterium]|nr:16S rRNA (uracil(1498)-N(3))-methyltransferase [Micropepsaceae bacterium]
MTGSNHARAPRLFVTADLCPGAEAAFDEGQAHYLRHVLRLEGGAPLLLFNGRDGEWRATLAHQGKRGAAAHVAAQTRAQIASPDIWLLFAPIKRTPADFIAQKATELGVSALMPVITRRTIVSRVNDARMKANAIEAAEQCERLDVPACHAAQDLMDVLGGFPADRMLVFADEAGVDDGAAKPVAAALAPHHGQKRWALLIGPEGGFEPAERDAIRALKQAVPVTLGPRILRADTAALAGLALLQANCGDWV